MKDRSSPNLLYSLFVSILIIIPIFLFTVSVISAHRTHAAVSEPPYSYWYHDERIVMTPSEFLIALEHGPSALSFAAAQNLQRDPLSDRDALQSRGITLYRTTTTPPSKQAMQMPAWTLVDDARSAGIDAHPVFHSGDFLQIPTDEVIVAFQHDTTVDEARSFLNVQTVGADLLNLRFLRRNTFIAQIGAAANGRAFAVSRALTVVPGIVFAEPNFLMVRQEPDPLILPDNKLNLDFDSTFFSPLEAEDGFFSDPTLAEPQAAPVGWTTVLSEGFESTAPGWTIGVGPGAVNAVPVIQTLRKRSGNRAIYMTGGGSAGVPAPGPYPNNANAFLLSPPLNLAPYQEAYVELWFYAKYEDPSPPRIWDGGALIVFDPNVGEVSQLLVVPYTGDLTADPTTQNGWRKVLFRIPPSLRTINARVAVRFFSDSSINKEGLYIDDVRVVGTTNVDTTPLGNDPYGARHYEFKNSGQIAGLGGAGNDLNLPAAWQQVGVSNQLIVAVIDDGVELNHPDLNLVTGYDADTGTIGGGPRGNHGTACAGNVGAIRNNARGVLGTAPGVKIMPIYIGQNFSHFAKAIDLAVANGARVLSNSWGWVGSPSSVIEAAIGDALAAGRTVLFAAGNGPDRPPYTYQTAFPCNLTATTNVICVGASSPTDEHKGAASSDGIFSWGSSYIGAGPDVVAPGPWSYTTDRLGAAGYNQSAASTGVDPDYTHDFGGTSSSTPKVAGIVALMLSKNPTLSPQQVKTILRSTARDIGALGVDERTGAGRVDAYAAVLAASPCNHLVLQNRTVNGTETHSSCQITAGPAFVVTATGDATFRAEQRITLRPGFAVRAGGRFRAQIAVGLATQTAEAPAPATGATAAAATPWPPAAALTWSELPKGLQARLRERDATVRDAQQSADGELIVFATDAALVAEDANGHRDVYAYAADTDALWLISANPRGAAAAGPSHSPRLDGEGRHVIYLSTAGDLVAEPGNEHAQLYHHDLGFGTTARLTRTAAGRPGAGASDQPLLAGPWAIYRTEALDLAPAGPGLYRQHLHDGRREAVGLDDGGQPDPRASHPAADTAGAEIAYQRPDPDERRQIYLTALPWVERLSLADDPDLGPLDHCCAVLSTDGRYLAYREQGADGPAWLHLRDRARSEYVRLPWPDDPALAEQAPRFRADAAALEWLAPEQGPDLPEVLHRLDNPLHAADAR